MISSENLVTSPIVSVPVTPPTTPNNPIIPPILNRRPIGLSILLLLLIGSFLYRTIASVVVIAVLTNSVAQNHVLLPIFSVAPFICIFPIIGAITVVFLIYLFLKTKDLSTGNYKFLITSLTIVPLLYTLLVYLLLSQTQTIYSTTSLNPSDTSSNPMMPVFSAILNEINLFSLITLLVVKKKKDLFTNLPSGLNWLQKIILVILGLIIMLPTFSETFTVIHNSLYPDTKYAQVRTEVGHKLYSPKFLPQNLKITSQYYIDDKNSLKLPNPIVKVAYDVPINKKTVGSVSKTVVLSQSLTADDFNLVDYLSKQNSVVTPQQVELSTAINKTGYLVIPTPSANSKMDIKYLYLITHDNIFINLATISPQIKSQDLIDIANSLN